MSDNKKVIALPEIEQIEAEAAHWLTVMGREVVSDAEMLELKTWLKQSDRNRIAFNELADLWDDMSLLQELDDIAESTVVLAAPTAPFSWQGLWQGRLSLSMAASLLVGVILAGLFYVQHLDGLNQRDAFMTVTGQQRTIQLSDGSTLQLNTDSHVEVNFSRTYRSIQLLRGEAHFVVAKNKQRPFYVYAGDGVVRAVGTAFTVRLRLDDEVEVTVEEGRVALASVLPLDASDPVSAPHLKKALVQQQPLAELTAGQSVVFGKKQIEQISQMQPPELSRKLAWRQGMLAYASEPLSRVVDDISRYTDIKIEITDPALLALPVAGFFRVGEVDALFDSLEVTFGLKVERISDTHVRLSQAL